MLERQRRLLKRVTVGYLMDTSALLGDAQDLKMSTGESRRRIHKTTGKQRQIDERLINGRNKTTPKCPSPLQSTGVMCLRLDLLKLALMANSILLPMSDLFEPPGYNHVQK